eukprot:6676579-Lingulodinium_polyedra.AAC.1
MSPGERWQESNGDRASGSRKAVAPARLRPRWCRPANSGDGRRHCVGARLAPARLRQAEGTPER